MAKNAPTKSSFSRIGISFGVLLQTACVVFLLGAVNYIGFNYYKRWDFSRSQKFTLADQTEQVLRQLHSPLEVVVYFSPNSLGPDTALYGDVQNLLAQLAFSSQGRLKIRYVDPSRDVGTATQLQEQYKFDGTQNVLVLDYEGRTKILPIMDLGDFDMSGLQSGQPVRLEEFKGEAAITAALIQLQNPKKARIYFAQGHGETLPGDLTVFNDALSRQNAEGVSFNLGLVDHMPLDADAVCIVGARYDFTPAEIKLLDAYWRANGRIVVLLDPAANLPNLRKFLIDAGIHPANDRVQIVLPSLTQPGQFGILRTVRAIFLPGSAITKRLIGANALLPGATQSLLLDTPGAVRKDVQLRPLMQAVEKYWGETSYNDQTKDGLRYDDGVDFGEPLILAASAEKGAANDERTDVASSRMVVVGNCAFITDESLRQAPADLDFILSVFNRMIERSKLTGITPKSVRSFSLSLTDAQIRGIALYTLIVIPAAAALMGLIMGFRRRS